MASDKQATYTPNLNLEKPGVKQFYDINVHNANSDKIDTAIKQGRDALNEHKNKAELDHPSNSVKEKHLATNSVSNRALAPNSVNTDNVVNNSITSNKLANIITPNTVNGITYNSAGQITDAKNVIIDAYSKQEANENFYRVFGDASKNADWNNWSSPGTFRISGLNSSGYRNHPQGAYDWGLLSISKTSTGAIKQEYHEHQTNGSIYTRMYYDGRWVDWYKYEASPKVNGGDSASWCKNGDLILQWGEGIFESNQYSTFITLPIAFKNKFYKVFCTDLLTTDADIVDRYGGMQITFTREKSTESKMKFITDNRSVGSFHWLAIGS